MPRCCQNFRFTEEFPAISAEVPALKARHMQAADTTFLWALSFRPRRCKEEAMRAISLACATSRGSTKALKLRMARGVCCQLVPWPLPRWRPPLGARASEGVLRVLRLRLGPSLDPAWTSWHPTLAPGAGSAPRAAPPQHKRSMSTAPESYCWRQGKIRLQGKCTR